MTQIVQTVTSVDSRLLRSLRVLITRPGVFSTSLHSHMYDQDWRVFARTAVEHKLQAEHVTLAAYGPVFDHAVDVNAKSLVIFLVLPFTLLLNLEAHVEESPQGEREHHDHAEEQPGQG